MRGKRLESKEKASRGPRWRGTASDWSALSRPRAILPVVCYGMSLAEKPADLTIQSLRLAGCRGTTIGTRVDLKGDLIVNQYLNVDGLPQPANLKSIKNLLVRDSTGRFSWWSSFSPKILVVSILLALLVAGAVVGTVLFITRDTGSSDDGNEDSEDNLPKNYTERLRTRGYWSAKEVGTERKELLYSPAKFVVVAHTAGSDCDKPIYCENLIRGIQAYHIKEGLGDIGYNFLIGGDGYIYEGLGWGQYGAHTYGMNCASVGIAFMGNYDRKRIRTREKNAFGILLEEGLRRGELEEDYKLFGHSQIISTGSPGLHIAEKIKTWDHYSTVKKEDFICLNDSTTAA